MVLPTHQFFYSIANYKFLVRSTKEHLNSSFTCAPNSKRRIKRIFFIFIFTIFHLSNNKIPFETDISVSKRTLQISRPAHCPRPALSPPLATSQFSLNNSPNAKSTSVSSTLADPLRLRSPPSPSPPPPIPLLFMSFTYRSLRNT